MTNTDPRPSAPLPASARELAKEIQDNLALAVNGYQEHGVLMAALGPLFTDRQRLVERSWCDACGGTGKPASGKPCMCNGTGLAQDAVCTLRDENRRLVERHAQEAKKLNILIGDQQAQIQHLERENKRLVERAGAAEQSYWDIVEDKKHLEGHAEELAKEIRRLVERPCDGHPEGECSPGCFKKAYHDAYRAGQHLRKAIIRAEDIASGKVETSGTEPEEIQPLVEHIINGRQHLEGRLERAVELLRHLQRYTEASLTQTFLDQIDAFLSDSPTSDTGLMSPAAQEAMAKLDETAGKVLDSDSPTSTQQETHGS